MRTYYDVLRLQPGASSEQIRVTYRVLAKELHPDVNHAPDAAERFKEAKLAFEVVSDPQQRRAYDATLAPGDTAARSRARGQKTGTTSTRGPNGARGMTRDANDEITNEERQRVLRFLDVALADGLAHSRDELIAAAARSLGVGSRRARKLVNRVVADGVRGRTFVVDDGWMTIRATRSRPRP